MEVIVLMMSWTFFIKSKVVTDIILKRPSKGWPIQDHKGLKKEKYWKNAHTNEEIQRQHEQQQSNTKMTEGTPTPPTKTLQLYL